MSAEANMKMRLDVVDPISFADHASKVLMASWKPTCLHYPAEYLRWEFGFPGNTSIMGVGLMIGGEPTGFAALLPRTLRLDGVRTDVHLLSFVAVLPSARGRGLSTDLYQTLLSTVKKSELPVFAFAQAGSMAEQLLVKNLEMAGLQQRPIGHYASYGSPIMSAQPPSLKIVVEEMSDEEEFKSVVNRCKLAHVLYSEPDSQELEHYRKDPRERAVLVVRGENGSAIGAAMVIRSELITPSGIQTVAMLDSVFFPEPSAEALRALVHATGRRWNGRVSSPLVTASNLWGIDSGLLRSAGIRAISTGFNGYVGCANPDHPCLHAQGTNREIV